MIDFATVAAGRPTRDTRNQRLIIYAQLDHVIQWLACRFQQLTKRSGLRQRARETVKDETAVVSGVFQLFADQADHDLVGHQITARHDIGNHVAHLCPAVFGFAQHVTSGKLHHIACLNQMTRLCTFTRSGWS